ncbi:MAG: M42 family peptidase, partial [Clostridia bacterium]|nr:M42 family peptidase [Clostridia bacterium]
FSVQEEVGGLGAMTAAFGLSPDVCLAVDVGFASFPGQNGHLLEMGKGAGISFSDTLSRSLAEEILHIATQEHIPYQLLAEPGETGTNAHEVQVTGRGIPSAVISIPLSYMHSPSEVVSLEDLNRTAELLCAYCCFAESFPKEVTLVG